MQSAQAMPWEAVSLCRAIVPQPAGYLLQEEGAQWRLRFEQEPARLEAA
jgi:hypothetical protein